ncbi:unnamed protein product [Paramecium primaurelia]|uniref:Uncharacterized protein n=1 Tax=Paramecium primaurelia TaxID=5886 RepID=A0A8S1QSX2_PARPR|nr:unnamed protein product [Paramecium primaurelia]
MRYLFYQNLYNFIKETKFVYISNKEQQCLNGQSYKDYALQITYLSRHETKVLCDSWILCEIDSFLKSQKKKNIDFYKIQNVRRLIFETPEIQNGKIIIIQAVDISSWSVFFEMIT